MANIKAANMKLDVVPRAAVEHTLKANSQPELGLKPCHNSHHHMQEEIQAVLPEQTHTPPNAQPWILFDPFVELVAELQGLDHADVHTITLPSRFLTIVEQCGASGDLLQTLSASSLEDLEETFPKKTDEGRPISELFANSPVGRSKGYFARISTCSLKDSFYRPAKGSSRTVSSGSGSVTQVEQLWQRIATSARAVAGIKDLRAAGLQSKLFLLPWNDEIRPQREYRIFCAPGRGDIAAVSQYRWFEPWTHFEAGEAGEMKMRQTAQSVLQGTLEVHQSLMAHPEVCHSGVKEAGFTFDVVERPDGTIALLELNDFGAMTGCGSCLYHWIHDAKTLYAANDDHTIEFRVLAAE